MKEIMIILILISVVVYVSIGFFLIKNKKKELKEQINKIKESLLQNGFSQEQTEKIILHLNNANRGMGDLSELSSALMAFYDKKVDLIY